MLIIDGHAARRARIVRDWVAATPTLIELHLLPGASPELNAAEYLKPGRTSRPTPSATRPVKINQLKADVRGLLRSAQRRSAKVARYFREHHGTYAAAPTI